MIFGYTILFASIGYLLGGILFAQILSLTIAKKNIRELGSHNPGATNLTRNTNKTLGGAATLLDATKGYLAILICAFIADAVKNDMLHHLIYISGLFAVIGHCFPIVYVCSLFKHKFNHSLAKKHLGGKGVATFGGITFAFSPWIGLICLGLWWIIVLISKYVSLASIISCSVAAALILVQRLDFTYLMPYSMTDAPYDYWIFVMCGFYLLAATLVTIRHKGNIGRLIKHTESKVFVKKHASSK